MISDLLFICFLILQAIILIECAVLIFLVIRKLSQNGDQEKHSKGLRNEVIKLRNKLQESKTKILSWQPPEVGEEKVARELQNNLNK